MKITRQRSAYPVDQVELGIVHLGLGAFMRCHLAVYTEKLLNQDPDARQWGICAANLRSNAAVIEALHKQGMRYNVAEFASDEAVVLREVNAIREAIFHGPEDQGDGDEMAWDSCFYETWDSHSLLGRLQSDTIRLVTLTVTEKGYYLNPADGTLLAEHPRIIHDRQNPQRPCTPIGILCATLQARRRLGRVPYTVLSCDNLPENGRLLKSALVQFADKVDPSLADWIRRAVTSPCSMVDRIVPAMTCGSREDIQSLLMESDSATAEDKDNVPVACEAFCQWVIEDDFPGGRPSWQLAGAQFVSDVTPYETMKLRMLNGSHSLLAYLGELAGYATVAECVQDNALYALIQHYMLYEAMPTLALPESEDLRGYAHAVLARFANSRLQHRTAQIAMDGSQKIPQRWLHGACQLLEQGVLPRITVLGLAAWLHYLGGKDDNGRLLAVDDPMAEQLQAIHQQHASGEERVRALLATAVFRNSLPANDDSFFTAVVNDYNALVAQGTKRTIQQIVECL